jgi:hypothetical protein
MAQYSKQWCDVNELDTQWSFDIEAIADTLPKNSYRAITCDGFGFTAIGKSEEFGTLLYFKNRIGINSPAEIDDAEWVRLEEMLQNRRDEIANNTH